MFWKSNLSLLIIWFEKTCTCPGDLAVSKRGRGSRLHKHMPSFMLCGPRVAQFIDVRLSDTWGVFMYKCAHYVVLIQRAAQEEEVIT